MRKIKFVDYEYYHIYNRGVDKRDVFLEEGDYERFLNSLKIFNNDSTYRDRDYFSREKQGDAKEELSSRYRELSSLSPSSEASELSSVSFCTPKELHTFINSLPKLVDIICYCLNPNHFHFILKQLTDKGIERFMHKLSSGYTNYFNIKYKRNGSLFQRPFKAVKIKSFDHLVWLSVYVNMNAQIHGIINDVANYPWSSYADYLGIRENDLCHKEVILAEIKDYKKVAQETVLYIKEKKNLQKDILE